MGGVRAIKLIEQMLKKDFKYLYKKENIDINTWHFITAHYQLSNW